MKLRERGHAHPLTAPPQVAPPAHCLKTEQTKMVTFAPRSCICIGMNQYKENRDLQGILFSSYQVSPTYLVLQKK